MKLSERDKLVNWHPFTQMKTAGPSIPIVKGNGTILIDEDGNEYIDAISSWWVNIHGHSNKYIAEKIYQQLTELEHVIFAGFTHPKAIELSEKLLELLPSNQSKVFYSDNGSTSVEVALKMAIQYWFNKGEKRKKIIAFNDAYHGDTFGSMSSGGRSIYSEPFTNFLFDVVHIDVPQKGNEKKVLQQFKNLIADDVAAFIFEPLVQGAAGMVMYDEQTLEEMIKICKHNSIITIADEVATGFYRTGEFLATDHLSVDPDIICLSKGITGGTMALGATTATEKIFQTFYADEKPKMFLHGHSYTANAVACSAAVASLELLESAECKNKIELIKKMHSDFLQVLKLRTSVTNFRQLGTILAFDINTGREYSYYDEIRDKIYTYFISNGILCRPLGNTVYLLPPYSITKEELTKVYNVVENLLTEIENNSL